MATAPLYPGTAQVVAAGDRALMQVPGEPAPRPIDVWRVEFDADGGAVVSSELHPEVEVPVAWLTYVGPTPDRWVVEVAPGSLAGDVDLVDGIDVSPGAERDALDRLVAALRAVIPAGPLP